MKLTVAGETLSNLRSDNQEGEGEGVRNAAEGAELTVSDIFGTVGFGDGLDTEFLLNCNRVT